MQVEMLHIGDQHGFHILLLQLAIQREIELGQRIATDQLHLQGMLLQGTLQTHV